LPPSKRSQKEPAKKIVKPKTTTMAGSKKEEDVLTQNVTNLEKAEESNPPNDNNQGEDGKNAKTPPCTQLHRGRERTNLSFVAQCH
jgi:hypothetical protein